MRTRKAHAIQTPVHSRSEDGFAYCFVLTKFRLRAEETDKDEQKEQFEDIENPSAEEILKQIKECYGEAVGKAFEGENLAYMFWVGNCPECYKPSQFLSVFSFLLLFGVFLFNNNNLWYFALAKT